MQNSLKYVPKGSTYNKPALAQIIIWTNDELIF